MWLWLKKPNVLLTCLLILAIFVPRLVGLGTILTVDEPLWENRGQGFMTNLSVLRLDKTLVAGQPGVITAFLVGLTTSNSLAVHQASISLITGFLILISTYFLTKLVGIRWGLLTGFWLALDPFLLGHSRVVHTDALASLFYLTSMVALLAGIKPVLDNKPSVTRYILCSAIAAAAAMLTKFFTLFMAPTAILILIGISVYKKIRWQDSLRLVSLWLGTCAMAIFIMWPALWLHADNVYDYMFSRASLHAGGTREEETTSTSWYYLREGIFRTTVPITLFLPFGIFLAFRKKDMASVSAAAIALSGLAFSLFLSASSDKSDRYILYTMISLIPLATLGYKYVCQLLKKHLAISPLIIFVLPLLPILFLAIDNIRIHPYYLSHYNHLYPIEQTHKLGWGEGLEQAAAWIKSKSPEAKVLSYYPRVFSYFYSGEVETVTHIDEASSDYVVLYRSMFERGEGAVETDIMREYLDTGKHTPLHVIYINSLPYVWIFSGT